MTSTKRALRRTCIEVMEDQAAAPCERLKAAKLLMQAMGLAKPCVLRDGDGKKKVGSDSRPAGGGKCLEDILSRVSKLN